MPSEDPCDCEAGGGGCDKCVQRTPPGQELQRSDSSTSSDFSCTPSTSSDKLVDDDGICQPKLKVQKGGLGALHLEAPKRKRSAVRRGREVWTALVTLESLPDYLKDNEMIRTGYRPEMSWQAAMFTIFRWHNEALNIWTHLFGWFAFIVLMIWFGLTPAPPPVTPASLAASGGSGGSCWVPTLNHLRVIDTSHYWPVPHWPLFIFQLGCIFVFTTSTLYHVLCCVSQRNYFFYRTLDFTGIVGVMLSMFWPLIWYAWECNVVLRWVYLTGATVVAAASLAVVLMPFFHTNEFHVLRVVVFGLNAVWGAVAMLHVAAAHWEECAIRTAALMAVGQIFIHALGAACYAFRIPERFFRHAGSFHGFDYLQGHTIFHICIVVAFLVYNEANMILWEYRNALGGCALLSDAHHVA